MSKPSSSSLEAKGTLEVWKKVLMLLILEKIKLFGFLTTDFNVYVNLLSTAAQKCDEK